jgi:hypothetical protein
MPPLQALVALHVFWVLGLIPPVIGAIYWLPAVNLRVLGKGLMWVGMLGLVIVAIRETLTWLPGMPPEDQRYLPQRILFVLATLPEVPLVQIILAGLACRIAGRRLSQKGSDPGQNR